MYRNFGWVFIMYPWCKASPTSPALPTTALCILVFRCLLVGCIFLNCSSYDAPLHKASCCNDVLQWWCWRQAFFLVISPPIWGGTSKWQVLGDANKACLQTVFATPWPAHANPLNEQCHCEGRKEPSGQKYKDPKSYAPGQKKEGQGSPMLQQSHSLLDRCTMGVTGAF